MFWGIGLIWTYFPDVQETDDLQRPGDKWAPLRITILHENELKRRHLFRQAQLKVKVPLTLQHNLLSNNLAHPQ